MAKKVKLPHVLPKRIAGVKVPKEMRNFARSPLGAALIANVAVTTGRDLVTSPQLKTAFADVGSSLSRALIIAGHQFSNVAHAAADKADQAADRAEDRLDTAAPRRRRRDLDLTETAPH